MQCQKPMAMGEEGTFSSETDIQQQFQSTLCGNKAIVEVQHGGIFLGLQSCIKKQENPMSKSHCHRHHFSED